MTYGYYITPLMDLIIYFIDVMITDYSTENFTYYFYGIISPYLVQTTLFIIKIHILHCAT